MFFKIISFLNDKDKVKIKFKVAFELLSGLSVDLLTLFVCHEGMWMC